VTTVAVPTTERRRTVYLYVLGVHRSFHIGGGASRRGTGWTLRARAVRAIRMLTTTLRP
jgi:hypothetical protein